MVNTAKQKSERYFNKLIFLKDGHFISVAILNVLQGCSGLRIPLWRSSTFIVPSGLHGVLAWSPQAHNLWSLKS